MRNVRTLPLSFSGFPAIRLFFLLSAAAAHPGLNAAAEVPKSLAVAARVSASSQFNDEYAANKAATGVIPSDLQPTGGDWAVRGTQNGWFELQWGQPVEAAQIVYYARTTSPLLEVFKDYAVYLNGEPKPVVQGTLEHRRGPQKIALPKQRVTRVRIEFLSSHPEAQNPGAAEIAVYGVPITDAELDALSIPPEEKTPQALTLRKDLIAGRFGFRDILLVKRKPLDISHVYVYHVEGYRPGGGLYVFTPDESGGQLKCIFDAGQGMITTADLSYDGQEIVFALRRGGHVASNPMAHIEDISRYPDEASNYHLFRINIDGSGLVQLTHGAHNNLDPCWLPDGGIAFMSDRKPAYAYCWVTTSPVLYRMERDGSKQQRLSANYLMDFTPSVLNSGRIIYTRWEYVDRPACPIQSLWTINPDGTGLAGFYGNRVLSPGTFMDAQPIPNTNCVLATATNHNGPCRGGIVAIDPTRARNAREAVRNLTPEIDIYAHRVGGGPYGNGMLDCGIHGAYEKPLAIDEHRFLVSKGGVVQIRDFDAHAASLLGTRDGMGFYSPQPVREQTTPPVLRGNVMDRDAELPEDGSVSGNWATVYMQDVYNGLEPHVKRGEIKQIAVVQEVEKSTHSPFTNKRPDGLGMRAVPVFGFQFPLVSCGATYAPEEGLGPGRRGRGRQRGVSRAFRGADLLPGARRRGPSRATHADLHALDARRGPGLRRLPRRPQLDRAPRQPEKGDHSNFSERPGGCWARIELVGFLLPSGTSPAGVGCQGIQLSGGRPGRLRPPLHRVSQRARAAGQRGPDRRPDRLLQRLVRRPLPDRYAGRAQLAIPRQPFGRGV